MADVVAKAIRSRLEWTFENIGATAASRHGQVARWALCAIPAVVCLLLSIPAPGVQWEGRTTHLWTPTNIAQRHRMEYMLSQFGVEIRDSFLIYSAENVLEREAIMEIMEMHNLVVETVGEKADGSEVAFGDVCLKQFSPRSEAPCAVSNFLSTWSYNATKLAEDPSPGQTLAALDAAGVTNANAYMGHVVRDAVTGVLQSAEAVIFVYQADGEMEGVVEWEGELLARLAERSEDWEHGEVFWMAYRSFDDEMQRSVQLDIPLFILAIALINIYLTFTLGAPFSCTRGRHWLGLVSVCTVLLSLGASFGVCALAGIKMNSINALAAFVLAGVTADNLILITDFFDRTSVASPLDVRMGKAMEHAGSSMTLTTWSTMIAFASGIASVLPGDASFSALATLAFFFNYVLQVTMYPTLLSLDEQRRLSGRQSCLCCIQATEPVTLAAAGAASSTTELVAVKKQGKEEDEHGAASAATKEEADQKDTGAPTRSPSAITLAEGTEVGAAAVALPPTSSSSSSLRSSSTVPLRASSSAAASAAADSDAPTEHAPEPVPWETATMRQRATRLLSWGVTHPVSAAGIMVAIVVLAIVSVIAFESLPVGLDPRDVLPDGSYVADMMDAQNKYFDTPIFTLRVVLEDVDPSSAAERERVAQFEADLEGNGRVFAPVHSWMDELLAYVELKGWDAATALATPEATRDTLVSMMEDPIQCPVCACDCRNYQASVKVRSAREVRDGQAPVLRSFFEIRSEVPRGSKSVRYDESLHELIADNDLHGFVYNDIFLYRAADEAMPNLMIFSMIYAAGAVIVLLFLILDPLLGIVMGISIFAVDLILFGYMSVIGENINAVTLVTIMLGAGLSVDYGTHVVAYYAHAHGYNLATGRKEAGVPWCRSRANCAFDPVSQRARSRESVEIMGSSVVKGGLTTLLAVIVLAGANSQSFRTFFVMILGIMALGMIIGLLFLPAVLASCGVCGVDHFFDETAHDEEDTKSASTSSTPASEPKQAAAQLPAIQADVA